MGAADQLSVVFGALADPTRRAILARLAEGPATVNEIAEGIGEVSGAVHGTRQTVTASHEAAGELNATASRLTGLVGRFTV